jgi:hypothetical protein
VTDEELAVCESPSLPWRQGMPSALEVDMWAGPYPDSPGAVQPTRWCDPGRGEGRASAPVRAGRWLVHDPVSTDVNPLGDHVTNVVLAAIDGRVFIRNGYAFWQPLDGTRWATRARFLPCRRDGIPIALLRRLALLDRVLDPDGGVPDQPGVDAPSWPAWHEEVVARSGALTEIAREVEKAMSTIRGASEPGARPYGYAFGRNVLERLRMIITHRDCAWEENERRYLADAPGSKPPHDDSSECPTYYDGCNCYVAVLDHNIRRAVEAERRLKVAEESLATNLASWEAMRNAGAITEPHPVIDATRAAIDVVRAPREYDEAAPVPAAEGVTAKAVRDGSSDGT